MQVWLGFMIVAISNGGLRELLLSPNFGGKIGHLVSTMILCLLILLITLVTMPWIGARTSIESWRIGWLWLGLTVVFEFLAGHFLFGDSWSNLLADYNVAK